MKQIFYIVLLLMSLSSSSEAGTRGDVNIIEASENIQYLSQSMVKEYLIFYKYPNQILIKGKLEKTLAKLNNDLRVIARTTKDTDTKDILEFLSYSKEQIEDIFSHKPDKEKVALMLDYSETLLEGANSIANTHAYKFSKEEKMLMMTKKMKYLLERIMKYYIASYIGFDTSSNKKEMKSAILAIQDNLQTMFLYNYPENIDKIRKDIDKAWKVNKIFLNSKNLFIPRLMSNSIVYMENDIDKISLFHSRNQ